MVKYQMQFDVLKDVIYKNAYISKYEECQKNGTGKARSTELAKYYASAKLKTIVMNHSTNPLKFYVPNKPGEEVINTFATSTESSKTPIILYSAGNGLGKTEVSLHIIMNLVLAPHNGWFDKGVFKSWKFPKRIWYVTTPTVIESRVMPFIRGLFKVSQFEMNKVNKQVKMSESKEGSAHTKTVKFSNDWVLEFKTHDQQKDQFESASVGLIICDEPLPEHIYRALLSRRRMGAIMLLPMTPLDMEPYIEEDIMQKIADETPGYFMITGSVFDASKKYHPWRGHLEHEIIESMIDGYNEDERDARIYGIPTHFSERIYTTFRKENIVNPLDFPVDDANVIIQAVDPHDGRQCACVYVAVMPNGRKILFTETPFDKSVPFWKQKRVLTAKEEVDEWAKMEEEYGIPSYKIKRVMDKNFGWQARGGKTLSKIYYDAGAGTGRSFMFHASYKSTGSENEISFGHKIVSEMMNNILEDGFPEFVIWDSCYHSINGLKKYIRKRPTTKSDMAKAVGGTTIVEKYKDFPDAIRYALCSNFENYTKRVRGKVRGIRKKYSPVYYNYGDRYKRRVNG